LKLNLSWCLGFQALIWTGLQDSNFIMTNIISIWGMCHWEDEIVKGFFVSNKAIHKVSRLGGENGRFRHNRPSNV
jgi:hypothetical protein